MEEASVAPHVLLVSFPAPGHVNPLFRFAKRIAAKGLHVTFSTSFDSGLKIIILNKAQPGALIPIGRGHLRFEFFDDGWADDDPRRRDGNAYASHLRMVGSAAVANMTRRWTERGQPVSCIVNNPFIPWVLDVAEELNVPSAVLWVQSCAMLSTYYHFAHSLAEFPTDDKPDVVVNMPGLPTLRPVELPTFLLPNNPYTFLTEAILAQFKNLHKANWVFANTFEQLERDAMEAISSRLPVIPLGPLVNDSESENITGDVWADCKDWLDAQDPNSVVYVSVGSVVVLTENEMAEMANGLLNCSRPFLWVVREDCRNLLPKGFMEDVIKGKGKVISWSPQEQVLSHRSVACFVTHCGWNSTLEALAAGVPVIAYPQWGDQVPNAKFLVDVYGVGVWLHVPIKGEELMKRVDEVMEGVDAEKMKGRASEWKEAARTAVADGGSSDRKIQAFVDEVARGARLGKESDS